MQNGPENMELKPQTSEKPSDETGGKKSISENSPQETPLVLPTLVKRLITNPQEEGGKVEAVLALTPEQLLGFVNIGLIVLLNAGMLSFQDQISQSQMKEYLDKLDPNTMGQA